MPFSFRAGSSIADPMGPCILGLISPPGLLQPVFISLMGMRQGLFSPSLHKKCIGKGWAVKLEEIAGDGVPSQLIQLGNTGS